MLKLKNYQETTLNILRDFLENAHLVGSRQSFEQRSRKSTQRYANYYQPIEGLENIPYSCLRLPTGGGKTLLAAHSIGVASDAWLEQDYPLVLWLVPTNAIREQTLQTLLDPSHSNREILDNAFEGRVRVLDIADFEQLRPHDIANNLCIVIGTLATLRVDNTEGRRVYAHNENLEPHFSKVAENIPNLERTEEGPNKDKIKFSFRNILALVRPLVIIDEAHNATTSLSMEVLRRVDPSCIIEFTATPAANSNVLHSVSAAELKSAEMIKLPIILTEHKTWQAAVSSSVDTRKKLAEFVGKDKDFIRPIVLIQAEDKDEDVPVDVVERYLTEEEKIDRSKIAIATGDQKELEGINLLAPDCPIEFVITVQALKEGWDCPFAYVFCSVAHVHSKKDVEQILGRVLRMPYAQRRQQEELNRAYAHVSSVSWPRAVAQLHDRLVSMGFDEQEAQQFIKPDVGELFCSAETTQPQSAIQIKLDSSPNLGLLDDQERSKVNLQKTNDGIILSITGEVSKALEEKIVNSVPAKDKADVTKIIEVHRQNYIKSSSESGKKLVVPGLCLNVQGELELAEKELLLELSAWRLLDFPPELSEGEFSGKEDSTSYLIDVRQNRIFERYLGQEVLLDLGNITTEWTTLGLSRWLDRRLNQPDIKQEVLLEFIRKVLDFLVTKRKLPLPHLVRLRYVLEKAIREKIRVYRQQAYCKGYQEILFGRNSIAETSYEFSFNFDPNNYPASWFYSGSHQFNKHFYNLIGELRSSGEEFECTKAIDQCDEVVYWVRNLERKSDSSFWLPTSTDYFYPDFIAQLKDGRIFVVEYKGSHLVTADDAKEKQNIGELWQEKSGGKGLFLMISDPTTILSQLSKALRSKN